MRGRASIAAVAPLFLLCAIAFQGALSSAAAQSAPVKEFSYKPGDPPTILGGEWLRYDGLLSEAEIAAGAAAIPVTITLRATVGDLASTAPSRASTYHCDIRIEGIKEPRTYTISLPSILDCRAIYANGEQIFSSASRSEPSPLLYYSTDADRISLIVQVDPNGRPLELSSIIPAAPAFGDATSTDRSQSLLAGTAFFETGFFLILGLFVFLLFTFWRKNREFLPFALYLIASAAYSFSKLSALLQGPPSMFTLLELEYANAFCFNLLSASLSFFLTSFFREEMSRPIRLVLNSIPLGIAAILLAVLLLPGAYRITFLVTNLWFGLFGLAATIYLVRRLIAGNRRALWLVPAFVPAIAGVVCRVVFPESLPSAIGFEPAGHIAFVFIALLMMVKRVGDSFESVESLSDYVTSVSRTMRSFIPREFLESLNKEDVIDLRLGDHVRKEMTIFFSDIRAFTELSEKLTVEENFAFINSYLSRVVPIISENGGFVDKYVGDAIMALFAGPRGPDESIRSAIAMQNKIVEYNGHRAKMGYRPISMGVGIHTGTLMLGVVGVIDRMENTVISDAVNLASRLQQISKVFNVALVISEEAFKQLEDPGAYTYRFIGKVRVKGKREPIAVFEIFDGIEPELFERKKKANMFFEQGMLSYYQKDFAGAMYYFKRVLDIIPEDGASTFYLENCIHKAAL